MVKGMLLVPELGTIGSMHMTAVSSQAYCLGTVTDGYSWTCRWHVSQTVLHELVRMIVCTFDALSTASGCITIMQHIR